jgi:hypothetical protein
MIISDQCVGVGVPDDSRTALISGLLLPVDHPGSIWAPFTSGDWRVATPTG